MPFFVTTQNIDRSIEKLEGKVWDKFSVAKTLVDAPPGYLVTKDGKLYHIKEWTQEIRQRREKSFCIVANISRAVAIAGLLAAVVAVILLAFSAFAATVLGLTALGFGGLLLICATIAIPQEEKFAEQALLRVQKLWNERRYEVALAKMAKLTQHPLESEWQLDIFKEFQNRSTRPEAAVLERERPAMLFAAFLLPHNEAEAQSRIKIYTTFNNSKIMKRLLPGSSSITTEEA